MGLVLALAATGCPTYPPPLTSGNTLGGGESSGDVTASSSGATDDESSGATDDDTTDTGDLTGDADTTTGEPTCASSSPGTVGECDPYAQDCPAGEKCLPWADDGGRAPTTTRCSAVPPNPAQYGESCIAAGPDASGQDSCDVGLMCSLVDSTTLTGTCRELCKCGPNEGQCFEAPADCAYFSAGALPICLPHCDPFASICPDGEVCIATPLSDHPACTVDASGTGGAALDECPYPNTCKPGLWCALAADVPGCTHATCCTPLCDLDAPDCSAVPGSECVAWYARGEAPEPELQHIGLCRAP